MNHLANNITENDDQEEKIDFKSYFIKLLGYWWVFAISVLFCVAVSYIYIRYYTPIYQVTAKLLVEDEKKGGGNLNVSDILGDMGGLVNSKSSVDNEVEILKTRLLSEKVVRKLNLHITYLVNGTIRDNQLYKSPFRIELLSETDSLRPTTFKVVSISENFLRFSYVDISGTETTQELAYNQPFLINEIGVIKIQRNSNVPLKEKGYKFSINSIDNATTSLQKSLTVSVTNKLVTTIDLRINHTIPKMGEEILGELIQAYIEQNISEKNKMVESTIDFIDNRLLFVSRELGDIEGDIQSFKQVNELADITEQSKILVANTSEFAKQAGMLETQLNIVEALEDYLKDEAKNTRVLPNSVLPQDLTFANLVEGYNMLLQERDKLLLATTEENPYVKNLDERIMGLRKAMLANLNSVKKSTEISLAQIQKKINSLEDQIRKVPAHERTYLGMYRQQTLKQELYLFLLKKREETALTKTSNVSNAKVIDFPKSESRPHSPKKLIIILIGLAVGMILPIVIVYIIDFLNNRVQSKEDLLKIVHAPLLGEINLSVLEDEHIHANSRSLIAEQFRTLRTNFNFFVRYEKGMSILTTSSMPGEGKTFISINLGSILALSGKKVLMMDFDLRVAGLTDRLNLKGKPGISNYIFSSSSEYLEYVYPSGYFDNLFIMPSGVLPPNPAETIMSDKTADLIERLKNDFDYIVMDAPPIGMVSDAQLLNKYVAACLYIVRQGHTYKEQLEIPQDLYQHNKLQKLGIVLNGVKQSKKTTYGGYVYGEDPKSVKKKKAIA